MLIRSWVPRPRQSCKRVGWTHGMGWVGSGRVRILPDRMLAGRFQGQGRVVQHFGFLIISWYLNRYESSNTAFGFINFLRYLIYNKGRVTGRVGSGRIKIFVANRVLSGQRFVRSGPIKETRGQLWAKAKDLSFKAMTKDMTILSRQRTRT